MVYAEEGDRNMNMDEGRGGHWEEVSHPGPVTCSQGRQVRLCLPCHNEKKRKGNNKISIIICLLVYAFNYILLWFLCIWSFFASNSLKLMFKYSVD